MGAAEDMLGEITMVTSDQPGVIQKALGMGEPKPSNAPAKSKSESGKEKSTPRAKAESGDDSDSSVGVGDPDDDQDNTDNDPDNEDADNDPDSDEDQDQDPDDDADEDLDDEPKSKSKSKKPSRGLNKRFSKLTARLEEQDRIIEELRAKQAQPAPAATPTERKVIAAKDVVEEIAELPEPMSDDFKSYDEYLTAMKTWSKQGIKNAETRAQKAAAQLVKDSVDQLKADWKAEQETERAKADFEKIKVAHSERMDECSSRNKDFKRLVVENENGIKVSTIIGNKVMNHPKGPEVLLYLARNPKAAVKLNRLPAEDQLVEYGEIVARIKSSTSRTSKSETRDNDQGEGEGDEPNPKPRKLPKPLPKSGTAGGRGTGGPMTYRKAEELSFDDYQAKRRSGELK